MNAPPSLTAPGDLAAPTAAAAAPSNPLARFFKLAERGTTIRREVLAGLTTFATMSYILAVNPLILSPVGIDFGVLISVTALSAAICSALMGVAANYPIALAAGMGGNAFFAQICLKMGIPWQAALGLTFWNGVLFLALAASGVREKILQAIPASLKVAITAGIGLFIALIGLKNGGVLLDVPRGGIALGKVASPGCLLVLAGVVLNAVLVRRRVRGAMVLTILLITAIGLFIPDAKGATLTPWPKHVVAPPVSISSTFLRFDLLYLFKHFTQGLPIVLALFFTDFMAGMATILAVCQRGGMIDKEGNVPNIRGALTADAAAASIGAALGTSTVGAYVESAAGVEEGGRTGLTSLVVAGCFLLALFLNPLIRIIPGVATAPALILVGVFMMQDLINLDLRDLSVAVPAILTIILMPLASISDGMAIGIVVYILMMLATGRARELSPFTYLLAGVFLLHFVFE